MSDAHQEMTIPGVIYSGISKGLVLPPKTPDAWMAMHRSHVERLKSAWGSAMSRLGLDGVVIHNGLAARRYSRDDQYWPQAITPHFSHWAPYRETPALLILTPGGQPRMICEAHTSFWEGPAPALKTWSRDAFVIDEVSSLEKCQGLASYAFIGDDAGMALALGIAPEHRNREDLFAIVDQFRTLKSDFEVASIRAATEVAARGHARLRELFLSGDDAVGHSELSLHHAYLQATSQTDYDLPYGNIVAQGANCGILHHVHYDRTKHMGDLSLLVDAGAQCHGYAADITRTWSRGGGRAAGVFAGLIQAVDTAQKTLVEHLKVGKPYEELHNDSHVLIAKILKDSGLVNAEAEQMVTSGLTRLFFPHGLGHSLGLQVHDIGMRLKQPTASNPYLRNTSVITAGQVTTIEPGIYFIPDLMTKALSGPFGGVIDQKLLSELMPFGGIRIEDNILVTDSGPVNLTRDFI